MLARRVVVAFVLALGGGAALSAVALAYISSSLDDTVAVHDSLVLRALLVFRQTLAQTVSVHESLTTLPVMARRQSGSDRVRVGEVLSYQVVAADTTPPQLTVPANITKEATAPGGAVATYSASATDIVDGALAVSCTPASGSTFALGATTVNCSATDAHGNTGSGSFTVTVQDTTPPTIDASHLLMADSGAIFVPGPTNWSAQNLVPDCTDAVGVTTHNVLSTEGANQTFIARCGDAAGNTASHTFAGVNVDKTPAPTPTVSAPANNSTYLVGQHPILAVYSCAADSLSGLKSCTAAVTPGGLTVASGGQLDTSTAGRKTLVVTA